MGRIFNAVLFSALTFTFVSAQSGRRITASPTPAPAKTEDPGDFSESRPVEKRPIYRRPVKDRSSQKSTPEPTAAPEVLTEDDAEVLKVETDLITIPVSVFDRNGLYIPNLKQENFKIYEDGEEQEIAYFGTTEKPFTVVLLLDTSPSTEYKIEEIQRAAIAFVDQLKPQDKVMVIEFSSSVHVLTEPTGDRPAIYKAIQRTDFGGGTSLYDAVRYSLVKRLSKIDGRKAIVLFTDGVDTTSGKADYDSTIALAEESESLIFPIYYNTFLDGQGGLGGINGGLGGVNGGMIGGLPGMGRAPRGSSAEDYALGKRYLEDLAAYTGGKVFRPESTPGGLTAAFEGIAEELRRQYNIGYVPKKDGVTGQRKAIKVRVDRPNLVIRSRDSYIVGSKQVTAAKPTD